MRVRVILNPRADHGRAKALKEKLIEWSRPYGSIEVVETAEPGHAKTLAASAADAGCDIVVAAGGDGTIHEVINGLVRGGRSETTLGVIPIGSGNDFAYALGLSTDPETAVKRLFTGQPRCIDLARIEDDKGRYAIVDNGIGIGFDATISIESRNITRIHGFAMYTLATLRTIAFYYQTPHLEIRFDDQQVTQDALLMAIGVGPRAGGGFLITPTASHDDNLLDSCLVNPVGRLTMLNLLPKVMKGTHVTSKHVTNRRNQYINIKSNMPLPIHTDGEIFAYPRDDVRRITITSLPQAINVIT
jgi:YegS/Rv2252/BmrU family lipid kinase